MLLFMISIYMITEIGEWITKYWPSYLRIYRWTYCCYNGLAFTCRQYLSYISWLCSLNDKVIDWSRPFLLRVVETGHLHQCILVKGLYFCFSGLSLGRRNSQILSSNFIKRNHVYIWNWTQEVDRTCQWNDKI